MPAMTKAQLTSSAAHMAGRLLGSNGSRYSCPRQSQWVNSPPGAVSGLAGCPRASVCPTPARADKLPTEGLYGPYLGGRDVAAHLHGDHRWRHGRRVFIAQRYARLVRIGSRYWLVSGVNVHFGLFPGLEINIESLRPRGTGSGASATRGDRNSPPARGRTAVPATRQAPEGVARMAAQDSDPAAERG